MGIRRVTINFSEQQSATARAIFALLCEDSCMAFDVTLRAHEGGCGSSVVEFVASVKDVRELIAFLGEKAGVGTEYGATVAISDMLATMPPIDQRIAQRKFGLAEPSTASEPSATRQQSNQFIHQALTREEARARMTYDEILRQIDDASRLTFDFVGMILAAATIAAAGLVQDSSVTVVASMLLSPLMSPILAITFGLAVGHDAIM